MDIYTMNVTIGTASRIPKAARGRGAGRLPLELREQLDSLPAGEHLFVDFNGDKVAAQRWASGLRPAKGKEFGAIAQRGAMVFITPLTVVTEAEEEYFPSGS